MFGEGVWWNEVPILNDFDCPLLILTDNVVCVPSSDVISPTSILHECSSNCQSTTLQCEITMTQFCGYNNVTTMIQAYIKHEKL